MLAMVFSLYCPLIIRTWLKVVFMFVKDTVWSLFFLKSSEQAIIYPKISQNPTFKWCDYLSYLLHSKSGYCKGLCTDDWSDSSIQTYHFQTTRMELYAKMVKTKVLCMKIWLKMFFISVRNPSCCPLF